MRVKIAVCWNRQLGKIQKKTPIDLHGMRIRRAFQFITGLSPILYFDAILLDFATKLSNIWCPFDRLRTIYGRGIKKAKVQFIRYRDRLSQ